MTDALNCPRCTGQGGAHFAFCFLAQLWDRVMGPTHPMTPPKDHSQAELLEALREEVVHLRETLNQSRPPMPAGLLRPSQVEAVPLGTPVVVINEMDEFAEQSTPVPGGLAYYDERIAAKAKAADDLLDELLNEAKVEPVRAEPQPDKAASGRANPKPDGPYSKDAQEAKRGKPGAWAQPTTLEAEAAAQEFVATRLVAREEGSRTDDKGKAHARYLMAPELVAAYEEWAKENDKPVIPASGRMVGMAATKRFAKRQGPILMVDGKTTKPMCYFGAAFVGEDVEEPAEKPAEIPGMRVRDHAKDAAEIRELVNKAKQAARPTPAQLAQIAELEAENREIVGRTANKGRASTPGGQVRPGSEKMSTETRELVNALLDLDMGWEYRPSAGQRKGQLRAPDRKFRHVIATTFGQGYGKNDIQLRRYLNQNGYLPTADAPVSQLVAPQERVAATTPATPADSSVNVVRADGRVLTHDDLVHVEAESDAKPLTEEEMDRTLWDLYVDVRGGMDRAFGYHPDVESLYGLNKDEIRTAVREPHRVEVRPESKQKGYPVIRFSRGDVNVIMGFRDRLNPAVIRAEWSSLLEHDKYTVDRHGGGGSRKTTGLPASPRSLVMSLKVKGAEVKESSTGKTAEVSYKGQSLGKITVEGVTKVQVQNDYQRMQRKMQAIDQREEKVPATV